MNNAPHHCLSLVPGIWIPENSICTFIDMHRKSTVPPDSFSFAFVLKAAANYGSLSAGTQLHLSSSDSWYAKAAEMELARKLQLLMVGLRPNEVSLTGCFQAVHKLGQLMNNALVDMLCKVWEYRDGSISFRSMPYKSVVSWTSMIEGLAMHGHAEEAILVFHEMEGCGIRPDQITFVSLLYACSHAGLIEQGTSWNVELAEQVKARLFELEPDDSSDKVLLSNIYAIAGKWKEVATLRRSMADQKIKKMPGWSMIEVERTMYKFVAGEKSNEATSEAYKKLREIMLRLRVEGGYVAEVASVFHDIDEEEKEDLVSKHSEKLAVAFGISRLSKGKVIRIVKNLRICRDCHTVMKLISKVYGLKTCG
ncbi:hypothetical protein GQ457_03G019520 [Hibiscus cannabinus]